jgi:hypothetical protein
VLGITQCWGTWTSNEFSLSYRAPHFENRYHATGISFPPRPTFAWAEPPATEALAALAIARLLGLHLAKAGGVPTY